MKELWSSFSQGHLDINYKCPKEYLDNRGVGVSFGARKQRNSKKERESISIRLL